jgi:hypothetical protein
MTGGELAEPREHLMSCVRSRRIQLNYKAYKAHTCTKASNDGFGLLFWQ